MQNLSDIDKLSRQLAEDVRNKVVDSMLINGFEIIAKIKGLDARSVIVLCRFHSITDNINKTLATFFANDILFSYVNDKVDKGLLESSFEDDLITAADSKTDGKCLNLALTIAKVSATIIEHESVSERIKQLSKKSKTAEECSINIAKGLGHMKDGNIGIDGMHKTAACLWSTDLAKAHIWLTAQLPKKPETTDVKETTNAMDVMFEATTQLYVKGYKQTKDDWDATVKWASDLTKAWEQLKFVTANNLKTTSVDVKWMESAPSCGRAGVELYDKARLLLVTEFCEHVVDAAAKIGGVEGTDEFKGMRRALLSRIMTSSDIVTRSIKLALGTEEHNDQRPESKETLILLKSIADIWAKDEKVLHKVHLIGWNLLLAVTRNKAKPTIEDVDLSVKRLLEGSGEKTVVIHFKAVWIAAKAVHLQCNTLRDNKCYAALVEKCGLYYDAMAVEVIEEYFWTVYDRTDSQRWAGKKNAKFGCSLRMQVLQKLLDDGSLSSKKKKFIQKTLKNDNIEKSDDEVKTNLCPEF
eukprot:GHVS01083338.1.p1 GENE.GHVS01083338.1~~GHVS01083338.1.p1  ORF type:complete len:525 (-),score=54.31 GHVS01083338.1:91-1665(-)